MAATLVTTIKRFIGTSAERAALVVVGIPAGSTFFETDTGLLYLLSSAGTWSLKKPALQTELIASIGAKTDAAVTDPNLSASEISLLKGLLKQIQSGSSVDLRGKAANKPAASAALLGKTYWSVDTTPPVIEVCDGTKWVVI